MDAESGSHGGLPTIKYHGVTGTEVAGKVRVPFFLSHDRELAETYSEDSDNPTVLIFEDLSERPLLLDTPERFVEAWQISGASNAEGPFHPDQTAVFASWARSKGHDAIVIPHSAFEGDLGFDRVAGTIGEPQTIILDPGAVRLLKDRTSPREQEHDDPCAQSRQ